MIEIAALGAEQIPEAAALFVGEFARLRAELSVLPNEMTDPLAAAGKLSGTAGRSVVALEGGRVLGHLAWFVVERFRGTERRGAYVPEWGHGAAAGRRAEVYRALYRAAAAEWAAAGCAVHAITLLANDDEGREAWFWNGFGLAVVDAVREARPLTHAPETDLAIRRATAEDSDALAELDAEHVEHYSAPPVFMAPPAADSAASFAEFLARPKNCIVMAFDGDEPAGFMRFTGYDFDAVAVLASDTAAFCNGAWVRPGWRGRGAGTAMLQAALTHYAGLGFTGVYTNFESFNPEAASFWPRTFRPACYSLMRTPESLGRR